jgi:hypothetical protein
MARECNATRLGLTVPALKFTTHMSWTRQLREHENKRRVVKGKLRVGIVCLMDESMRAKERTGRVGSHHTIAYRVGPDYLGLADLSRQHAACG